MYLEPLPVNPKTTTPVKIKYDCCGKEHTLKWRDADENYQKNGEKHVCRSCGLKLNNPAKRAEVKAKTAQTNLERYGATCPLATPEAIQKSLSARDDKFYQERAEKTKQTNLERYGVEHAAQAEDKKQKARETNQERYGADHPMQNPEVAEKARQTNLERYGVDNVGKLPEVRAKVLKTMLERYGVEYYNQLPEMKDYLRANCKEWLADSYAAGGHMKGKVRPEAWNQKQAETVAKLIDEGNWKASYKSALRGTYKSTKSKRANEWFRSSYELRCHYYLTLRDDVVWYEYEPFCIPYYDTEGHKRWYFPDFVIMTKSGLILVEIKNDYTLKSEATKLKAEAAQAMAGEMGFKFEIWSNEAIDQMLPDEQIPPDLFELH